MWPLVALVAAYFVLSEPNTKASPPAAEVGDQGTVPKPPPSATPADLARRTIDLIEDVYRSSQSKP